MRLIKEQRYFRNQNYMKEREKWRSQTEFPYVRVSCD
jgi:hypothetical protein